MSKYIVGGKIYEDDGTSAVIVGDKVLGQTGGAAPAGFSAYWITKQIILKGDSMKKNVASQVIGVQMITAADGTAFTGAVTALITVDGGTQSASGGTGPTSEGNGLHTYIPTQAETNGDHIAFTFTGTGAIPATIQVYTGFPQTVDNNVLAAGATGFAAIDTVVDAVLVDTNELQTVLSAGILARTHNKTLLSLLQNLVNVVESQRNHHSHISPGEVFYVDPVNGATHASGARGGISDPYLTIQDCHDNAVTDSNHDVILLVPGAAAGVTTHTVAATTTLSKRFVLVRGSGRDLIITRTGSGDTLTITGEGVEIEGFQIGTAATGSGNGIAITADFAYVGNCWFNDTQGDGININQADNCIIENNRFQNTGVSGSGDGLEINGTGSSSNFTVVRGNIFENVNGDAIKISGGTVTDTNIYENNIHGSSGWGINLGAAADKTVVNNNTLGNNTSGDITDSGTNTVETNNVQWAKHSIATEARLAELDAANLPADVDAIPTTAMRGTDSAALASGVNVTQIAGVTAAATNLAASAGTIVVAAAQTGTLSTTVMTSDLTEATNDHYNGRIIIWTSGVLKDQATNITDYAGVAGTLTYTAVTEAPSNGDTFVIV